MTLICPAVKAGVLLSALMCCHQGSKCAISFDTCGSAAIGQQKSQCLSSEKFKGGGGLMGVSLRWSDQGPHEAGGEAVRLVPSHELGAEGERGDCDET